MKQDDEVKKPRKQSVSLNAKQPLKKVKSMPSSSESDSELSVVALVFSGWFSVLSSSATLGFRVLTERPLTLSQIVIVIVIGIVFVNISVLRGPTLCLRLPG